MKIISIPTHHEGKLLLETARNEFSLSQAELGLPAKRPPIKRPIIVIINVEDVKSNIVLGSFSRIISLTLEDPESLVKK
jgi:hypothetical protein